MSDNQLLFISDNQIPKLVYDLLKQINSSRFKDFSINNSNIPICSQEWERKGWGSVQCSGNEGELWVCPRACEHQGGSCQAPIPGSTWVF